MRQMEKEESRTGLNLLPGHLVRCWGQYSRFEINESRFETERCVCLGHGIHEVTRYHSSHIQSR